ncbi:LPS O-antigen chain length determinant protein WzzB [Pseudomonas corrugata]|uniref:LPS O-antigen chain length determinant protein WzzB n=1 Tax=Pseudomonas corrugata TaxID=47879 RepID=UPI001586A50C|nr:Wzz/FepE/Etk N-terminal domain-containing protein [Pseudomonas corrugata]MCI0994213.1 chain-length determining protein [Pseudomonas corrugata]NUT67395.1 chain-length determining protein [Pseudomonas corrugata]
MHNNRVDAHDAQEIDLIALLRNFWVQRWLVIGVTFVVTVGAGAVAYLSKPIYEARFYISPPTQNGIAELNYGRDASTGLEPYSIKQVYDLFARNLQSETLRQTFFHDIYLPSLEESQRKGPFDLLYENFSRVLMVGGPGKDTPERFSVIVQSNDAKKATDWTRVYVQRASEISKAELIKNVTSEAAVRARNLEQQIVSLRENALRVREDRIQQLREALKIAEAIDLKTPAINAPGAVDITVDTGNKMDYQRGSLALTAEVSALEGRVSDDAFIPGLRTLQMRYDFYRTLKVEPDLVSVYRQDGNVEVPQTPIKPNKLAILLKGMILGLVLGLAAALMRQLVQARVEK